MAGLGAPRSDGDRCAVASTRSRCMRPAGEPSHLDNKPRDGSTSGGNSSGNNSVAGEEDAPLTSLNFTAALTSRSPESRQKATIRWARAYRQKRRARHDRSYRG